MFSFKKLKQYFLSDGETDTNLNRFMKKKQNMIGFFLLIVMLIITLLLHHLSQKKELKSPRTAPAKVTAVDGILSTDFTQKNELSALEQQQQQVDSLKKELSLLKKQTNENVDKQSTNKADLIKEMKAILAAREAKKGTSVSTAPAYQATQPFSSANNSPEIVSVPQSPALETIQFHYETPQLQSIAKYPRQRQYRKGEKTAKNYVPAGTFAKVVLLEGADANASVNGQSSTVGILVRILDSGTLPNGHHSYLKGCFVLASIYGDISSERGEARLTKLSCTRRDGTILEKKVRGYLSFAGKEGIKGTPVMRNGKILAMAGISGLLSGVGSALQQSVQTQSISPLGVTQTVTPSKVWQNGLYGGANTAMNQLAHYYIQRADQYHPIIEIGSGTVATVIFQSGFSLTDGENESYAENTHLDPSTTFNNATTDRNDAQELKKLLSVSQNLSSKDSSLPFSNVN